MKQRSALENVNEIDGLQGSRDKMR